MDLSDDFIANDGVLRIFGEVRLDNLGVWHGPHGLSSISVWDRNSISLLLAGFLVVLVSRRG